ncbi:replication stress response regulator SDE2 isoform X1 [Bufo bufo]|uniref:replication stress response regulator SDE2 isoform X1 n=1 Tax=Bufo bufo TaxID=8384 RepID=UPI001ABE5DE4|nr:replication stress response regulator SDE2 isoform X1 [Bufo bufo]
MAAVVVWVREAVSGRVSVCEAPPGALVRDLLPVRVSPGPLCDFYVKCNGRRVGAEEPLWSGLVYSVEPRLCGGKGGFGSMLRALGAQIEKTTNREACRDLSGRRLRDVNHEKAMAEWIKKQAEREAEKEQRRLERLKRKLAEPKHYFTDPEYHRQCSDMSERLEDSVIKGLQASSSSAVSADTGDTRKRRKEIHSSEKESGKKKCLWTGLEGLEASSSSESGSESDSESASTSASCSSAGQRPQTSDSDSDGPAQCSSAAGQSPECSRACSSMCTDAEQPVCDPDNQPQSSSGIAITEPDAGHREADSSMQESTDVEQPVCDPDEQPQSSSSSAETIGVDCSMQDSEQPVCDPCPTDARVISEAEKPPAPTDPPQEASIADTTAFDLLSFTSAAELEALGLEKLKVELMALGLKCGGTLQERASRLFSVRGQSREQIDPSLFAKPSKGKKK